ncbi:hypothetical protein E2C01_053122 [Portunus trituberculatus]|uniref:Uncharacterized protein n=1 Tax=Portunus trituberculatus TaxID=210409 RepID=A0A5B7GPY9_PORTR|nr:hypothetical protein [Portunus trituberculatus]
MLPSSDSSGTTGGTESIPGRLGRASPGKPDDPGVTILEPPYGTKEEDVERGGHTQNAESSLPTLLPQPPSSLSSATAGKHLRHRRANYFPSEIYPGHGILLSYTVRTPSPKGSPCSGGPGDRSR